MFSIQRYQLLDTHIHTYAIMPSEITFRFISFLFESDWVSVSLPGAESVESKRATSHLLTVILFFERTVSKSAGSYLRLNF